MIYWRAEVLACWKLSHPNIVALKRIFLSPTHLGIVMEYVEGPQLFTVMQQPGFTEDHVSLPSMTA